MTEKGEIENNEVANARDVLSPEDISLCPDATEIILCRKGRAYNDLRPTKQEWEVEMYHTLSVFFCMFFFLLF